MLWREIVDIMSQMLFIIGKNIAPSYRFVSSVSPPGTTFTVNSRGSALWAAVQESEAWTDQLTRRWFELWLQLSKYYATTGDWFSPKGTRLNYSEWQRQAWADQWDCVMLVVEMGEIMGLGLIPSFMMVCSLKLYSCSNKKKKNPHKLVRFQGYIHTTSLRAKFWFNFLPTYSKQVTLLDTLIIDIIKAAN